jgi:type IV pilus assembly protein PilW
MKRHSGFTLVELMIATVIGLFLMASLMNLFIATNRSVTLSDALAQNQEAGRFGMDYMTKFIRQAGYSEDFTVAAPPILINTTATPCLADACSDNNPVDAQGARLANPYVADDVIAVRSCSGTVIGGPINGQQQVANVFWVSNAVGTENELRCRTFDYGNNVWIDAAPVSIVANIESFEFQLGIAAQDTDRNAARYVNLETIENDPLLTLNQVRSIRIALLTTSQDELDANKLKTNVTERKYNILDGPIITITDGNLRQVFGNTVELTNMIESAILN